MDRYILKNGKAVLEPNVLAVMHWIEHSDRIVAKTEVGELTVSTVFLSFDHSYDKKEPILWETMIFGGETYQERCGGSDNTGALEMHERGVQFAREHQ